jgi:hypothetical protein
MSPRHPPRLSVALVELGVASMPVGLLVAFVVSPTWGFCFLFASFWTVVTGLLAFLDGS